MPLHDSRALPLLSRRPTLASLGAANLVAFARPYAAYDVPSGKSRLPAPPALAYPPPNCPRQSAPSSCAYLRQPLCEPCAVSRLLCEHRARCHSTGALPTFIPRLRPTLHLSTHTMDYFNGFDSDKDDEEPTLSSTSLFQNAGQQFKMAMAAMADEQWQQVQGSSTQRTSLITSQFPRTMAGL